MRPLETGFIINAAAGNFDTQQRNQAYSVAFSSVRFTTMSTIPCLSSTRRAGSLQAIFPHRLFDHARSGKADKRGGFGGCEVVAQHRKLAVTPPVVGSVKTTM